MILIRNVKVVDGTGKPAYPTDVLIAGDKISALGNFRNKKADQVIEGLGGYLTPGFVDVHACIDKTLQLFSPSCFEYFIRQGVTSVIFGQNGLSLAPLLYGSIDSMNLWNDDRFLNIHWHTVLELYSALRRFRLGVNVATLVGHTTIRQALTSGDSRDLTDKEIGVFKNIISQALKEGALGFSIDVSNGGSHQSPYEEIKELVGILAHHRAVCTIRLRNDRENISESMNEVLKLYKETGVTMVISRARPHIGYESEYAIAHKTMLKMTDGMDCYYEACPLEVDVVPLRELLPSWACRGTFERIIDCARHCNNKDILLNGERSVIVHAPHHPRLVGREVTHDNYLDIMKTTKLRALVARYSIDMKKNTQSLFSDKALIASYGGGYDGSYGDAFTRYLDLASQQKKYSFEQIVRTITSLPARLYALKNRGFVREGYQADINIIINNQIQYVLVNGCVVMRKGTLLPTFSGQLI